MERCPYCGWHNPDGSKSCVKCGQLFVEVSAAKTEEKGQEPETDNAAKPVGRLTMGKTVNWRSRTLPPYRRSGGSEAPEEVKDEDTVGSFSLMMMPDASEDFMPYASKFEGHEVKLNRSNTDRSNKTITSKEQARLVCINNKWYIEDRSEMKTTFVRSKHRIELHSGDTIMLGDRIFRFDDLNAEPEELDSL